MKSAYDVANLRFEKKDLLRSIAISWDKVLPDLTIEQIEFFYQEALSDLNFEDDNRRLSVFDIKKKYNAFLVKQRELHDEEERRRYKAFVSEHHQIQCELCMDIGWHIAPYKYMFKGTEVMSTACKPCSCSKGDQYVAAYSSATKQKPPMGYKQETKTAKDSNKASAKQTKHVKKKIIEDFEDAESYPVAKSMEFEEEANLDDLF